MKNLSVLTILLMVFVFTACDKDSFDQDTTMGKVLLQESSIESRNSEEELKQKLERWKHLHFSYYRDYDPYMYLPEIYREEFKTAFEYASTYGIEKYLIKEFRAGRINKEIFDEINSTQRELSSANDNGRLTNFIDDYKREIESNQNSRVATAPSTSNSMVSGVGVVIGVFDSEDCNDGIQNQDETEIDCGGTFCAPCNSNDGQGEIEERGCLNLVADGVLVGMTVGTVLGAINGYDGNHPIADTNVGGGVGATIGGMEGALIGALIGAFVGVTICALDLDHYEECTAPTGIIMSPQEDCSLSTTVSLSGYTLGNGNIFQDFQWTGQNAIINSIPNPVGLRTSSPSVVVTPINVNTPVNIQGGPLCDDPTSHFNIESIWYENSRSLDFQDALANPAPVSVASDSGSSDFSIGDTDLFIIFGYNQYNNPNVTVSISMSPVIGGVSDNNDGSFDVTWFSSGATTITVTATNDCSGAQEQDSINLNISQ